MEENKIVYVCDRRKCECCSLKCTHTTDIEHAKNFHKEGDTFFEDDTLNKKVKNQAKEIRRLLKQKDELKAKVDKYESLEWANKFRNADILNSQRKMVLEENKRLKNTICCMILNQFKDKPELLSNDLRDIIVNQIGQDQEIERLLGKNQ